MSDDLLYPYGIALSSAVLKSTPGDFEVEEVLGFEPGGEGEHLFLWIEKEGLTTLELITCIARDYGIKPALVSHSGLKDKHALTRQWLSLHLPGIADPPAQSAGDGYRVLRQLRHNKKLRPGTHKANWFRLRLREIDTLTDTTRQQIESVSSGGFANYFGQQRFGRRQDNVQQALRQLQGRKLSRSRKGLLLSSLRSHLFNQILVRRIELGYWALPLEGDVFMLRGSHSIFSDALDADLVQRYGQLDISSCASLYGSGKNLLTGEPLAIEQSVLAANGDIAECLDRHGSRLQMRPLRAAPENFTYDYDAAGGLIELEFSLPTGSYATTLLSHFFTLRDAS
jgi:tRNA pseudouridine13 synthase